MNMSTWAWRAALALLAVSTLLWLLVLTCGRWIAYI